MRVNHEQAGIARFERLLTEDVYQLAWRYCCSLCPTAADAEDLLHEALYQALRSLAQLQDQAAFRSWLLAIVRRRFLNRVRAGRAEQEIRASFAHWEADDESWPDRRLVSQALSSLPERQRTLLGLFYGEGLSMRELARCMHTSELVIQGRLARARGAFKRAMLALDPRLQDRRLATSGESDD